MQLEVESEEHGTGQVRHEVDLVYKAARFKEEDNDCGLEQQLITVDHMPFLLAVGRLTQALQFAG